MISVVIPAYNEETLIGKCLDSLANQNTKYPFEVVLVDNNSTDNTAEIAKQYANKLNLHIIPEKKKGRGTARWRGFKEACGEIILSTDADTIVPANWIDSLVNTLKQSEAVAVTGTCQITDCSKFTNLVFNFLQPQFMKVYRLAFGHYWLSGFSFAVYKNAYEKSGGFNPDLNAEEDIELSFRVSKIGKIKFVPNLPVTFSGRRFNKGLIKGIIPYITTFVGYFGRKNKDMFMSDVR